jgi:beta-galactosidase
MDGSRPLSLPAAARQARVDGSAEGYMSGRRIGARDRGARTVTALLLPLCVLSLAQSSCRWRQEAARQEMTRRPATIISPATAGQSLPEARTPAPSPASHPGLQYSGEVLYFQGRPVHLWSGELPYYRIDPAAWGERLDAARAAGIRFITAYVPWNLHEPAEGRFDFTGSDGDSRRNLIGFIEAIARRGMYFIPKPGPFICAEVRHGGIPDWLTAQHPDVAMRDQHGRTVRFRQDRTLLPDHLNPTYLDYVRRWYTGLYEAVISKYQYDRGPIIAMQVENELIYSTSELADPFSWGYTTAVQVPYRRWLLEIYRDIRQYNLDHGTRYTAFSDIMPPQSREWRFRRRSDWLAFQDWVRFKGWYGGAVLREYAGMLRALGVTVPLYHNAGMLEDEAPMSFSSITAQIWLGVNFWLHPHPLYSDSSYVRAVRRLKQLQGSQRDRPIIAPEVNWGWGNAKEFDFLTRCILPYSRATNIYPLSDSSHAGMLAGRPYSTSPEPYPGDAPIDERGNFRPAYRRLIRLTRYTDSEGKAFAEALPVSSISLGSYSPYNAPELYTRYARASAARLRDVFASTIGANDFLQELMAGLIERDAEFDIVDLENAEADELAERAMLIVLSQEMMDTATQNALVEYVRQGGVLVFMPTVPTLDLELRPASVLKDTLLADLEIEAGRPLREPLEFRLDENGQRVTAELLTHNLKVKGASWRILGRTDSGDITAVEKPVGHGRLIYIGSYTADPDLFLWLARREGIITRYAYTEDARVEIVPLINPGVEVIYLFLVNRGLLARSVEVHYLDTFNGNRRRTLSASIGGHSVSILKMSAGGLRSASLYGGRGIRVCGEDGGLYLDRGTEVDLLEEAGGDLLLWADRATEVRLALPAGKKDWDIRVFTGFGREVPAVVTEGSVRFTYRPAAGTMEYYRIIEREPQE